MGLVQNIGRAGDLFASRPFGGRDIGMYQSEDWYMQPPPAAAMLIQIPAQNEEMQPRMGRRRNTGSAGNLLASRPFWGRDKGMYQSEDWYMQPPPAAARMIQIPAH